MKNIRISDITLRESKKNASQLSFRDKVEICRLAGRMKVDAVELPPVSESRTDRLLVKTVAAGAGVEVSCPVGRTEESVRLTYECLKDAKTPVLHIMLPVSPLGMEYDFHRKAPAMLSLCETLVKSARTFCERVEFSAVDATNAEPAFLAKMIKTAIGAGANRITVCDNAGILTPGETEALIRSLYRNLPELHSVIFSFEVADSMGLALASAAAALSSGIDGVKVAFPDMGYPTTENMARYIRVKGTAQGLSSALRISELSHTSSVIRRLFSGVPAEKDGSEASAEDTSVRLTKDDTMDDIARAAAQLGYELAEEDIVKVYDAFLPVAEKKEAVTSRELDAIIAATAMQVPSTYTLENYVTNSGNIITATASVSLFRDGERLSGISGGDGPVDALIRAIETVTGRHYDLDEIRIQSITEGGEAMGSALVRLCHDGHLYAGSGISTDVIGASAQAYLSALNKIVFEEEDFDR